MPRRSVEVTEHLQFSPSTTWVVEIELRLPCGISPAHLLRRLTGVTQSPALKHGTTHSVNTKAPSAVIKGCIREIGGFLQPVHVNERAPRHRQPFLRL